MDRLYSKEQIEEWASKRADDAGRLSRQLLDTLRENDRLRHAVRMLAYEGLSPRQRHHIASNLLIAHPNKES